MYLHVYIYKYYVKYRDDQSASKLFRKHFIMFNCYLIRVSCRGSPGHRTICIFLKDEKKTDLEKGAYFRSMHP